MQFAVPTRNHRSSPQLFSSVHRQFTRRRRPIYILLGLFTLIFLWFRVLGGDRVARPGDAPNVVLVTVLDPENYSEDYLAKVIENRREYVEAHGYGLFFRNITNYKLGDAPSGWARVPVTRHAMSEFKYSEWFWYLDQNAIIMNPSLSIEDHITNHLQLKKLMLRDVPIVPPYSVIHTYKHTPPERVMFILSQDEEGLAPGSFLVRQGPWARFFLDVWMDPLYRLYGFQKQEKTALDHIVQWHPTILTKLALVPQGILNSYPSVPGHTGSYQEKDLVINLKGCTEKGRSCESEFTRHWAKREKTKKR